MKENPTPHLKDAIYTGDDYVRATGEVPKFHQIQVIITSFFFFLSAIKLIILLGFCIF